MPKTYRPRSNDERETFGRAIDAYLAATGSDPAVVALMKTLIVEEVGTWRTTRESWVKADSAVDRAAAALEAADAAADGALQQLGWGLRDGEGKPVSVSVLVGRSVGDITRMAPAEAVQKTGEILDRLSERSDLVCEEPLKTALATANGELAAAASGWEESLRLRSGASAPLDTAAGNLDRAAGKLGRTIKGLLGDEAVWEVLPAFVRAEPKKDVGGAVP